MLFAAACTSSSRDALAPPDSPPPASTSVASASPSGPSGARFQVATEWVGEPDRHVPVEFRVRNSGSEEATPTCFLTMFQWWSHPLGDALSSLAPGERWQFEGAARFPIPLFNYESDGATNDVKCFVGTPRRVQADLRAYRGTKPGRPVEVPAIDGSQLHAVGYPLFRRGLRVALSPELRDSWRPRKSSVCPGT